MLRFFDLTQHDSDLLYQLYSTVWNVAHQSQIKQLSFFVGCKCLSELAARFQLLMCIYFWDSMTGIRGGNAPSLLQFSDLCSDLFYQMTVCSEMLWPTVEHLAAKVKYFFLYSPISQIISLPQMFSFQYKALILFIYWDCDVLHIFI